MHRNGIRISKIKHNIILTLSGSNLSIFAAKSMNTKVHLLKELNLCCKVWNYLPSFVLVHASVNNQYHFAGERNKHFIDTKVDLAKMKAKETTKGRQKLNVQGRNT